MKFGVVLPVDRAAAAGRNYEHTLRIAKLAEHLGFDFVTVAHHRFTTKWPASPLILLAAIAANTERIGLGTNILMLPTLHPLEVAEQVATIDCISGGRVFLGAGVGYQRHEFDAAGIRFESRGARMDEALQVIRKVLSEEDVTYEGRHFQFENVTVEPRPVQKPNPPLVVGAKWPKTVARAARLGDGWTTDSKASLPEISQLADLFWATAAKQRDERVRFISVTRDVGIAPNRSQLEDAWLDGVKAAFVEHWKMGMRFPDELNVHERLAKGDNVSFDELVRDRFIAGSPDESIAAIQRIHSATSCASILARFGYGPTFDEDALTLFASSVIPNVQ